MGYFSNGTEGADYQERWCSRCLHENASACRSCPIWDAHLIKNYDECNNKGSILHMLIPLAKDGIGNERCLMFVDRGLLSNLAIQQFEHEPV